MMNERNIEEQIQELVLKIKQALTDRHQMMATAESCTGGLIASHIVAVAGSSEILAGGIVAYQNEIKEKLLDVPAQIIETKGAVSEETVIAMAEGARKKFGCEWAVATSGIAGPGGAEPGKPVGFVWMCVSGPSVNKAFYKILVGKRNEIREKSVYSVLSELLFLINNQKSTCTIEH